MPATARRVSFRRKPLVVIAIAALVLTSGCAGARNGDAADNADGFTIGVSFPSQVQRRWSFDERYITAEANKLGDRTIVQYADYNPALQMTQIENMISMGADVIILAAVDAAAAAAAVERARKEGIKVIAYDLGISNAEVDLQVSRDNGEVGRLQVAAALQSHPTGNYAVVRGDSSNTVAQQMATATTGELAKAAPEVTVVSDNWTPGWSTETALSDAENILSRYNDDIAAFVVASDNMAGGVAQALRGRRLNGEVFVSGLDAEPASLALIASGDQTMTVFTNIEEEGRSAARGAHKLAAGEPLDADTFQAPGQKPVPAYLVSSMTVDRTNLCDFVMNLAPPGWVEFSQVFPNQPDACAGAS